jgi:hypothetical protein
MLDSTYVAFGCKRPGISRSDRFAPDAPRCSFASSLASLGVANGGERDRGLCHRQPGELAIAAPGVGGGGASGFVGVDGVGHLCDHA